MQSGYELVRRAIEFQGPERVPVNFDENRTPIHERYGDDFIWVFVDPAPDFNPAVPGQNELGVVYETLDEKTMGLPLGNPLSDLTRLDAFHIPDFTDPVRYRTMEARIQANPGKYVLGMFPHFVFNTTLDLLGFNHLMISVMDDRPRVEQLMDRLMESSIGVVNAMADRGVHGIIAIEDLGLQDRLMISPRLWRSMLKPRYARIIQAAHARGLHIFSHSCGYIIDIIDDFIDVGLDVLQIDQQDNMGIDTLAERFGGRICFFSPVDIQTTLPVPGNLDGIEKKARHLIQAFGKYNGGFMAKTYPQPESIRVPDENTSSMCAAFLKYGRYPLQD